jgi:hypothetical protein
VVRRGINVDNAAGSRTTTCGYKNSTTTPQIVF